ncbi:MAG: hypothetical protein ACFFGZ_11815 [Candidatus Thorarchaeota archaeon]
MADVKITIEELTLDIQPTELLVWLFEILFVFVLIIATEHYVLKKAILEKEQPDFDHLIRVAIAAILIIIILPIIGAVGQNLKIDDRSYYPVAVVLVFALTSIILRFFTEDEDHYRNLALTTIVLLVLYIIRVTFDIAII